MSASSFRPLDMLIDVNQTSLYICLLAITFNPTFWNIVARNEYRNKTITRVLARGNPRIGCYLLAITIFTIGIIRDSLYHEALKYQPVYHLLPKPFDILVPAALFIIGQTLVVTSTWSLGITGTFLGDYFGILMDHKVEGFPFNILRDPMYTGSTLCFAAGALWYQKPAGLLITLFVHIVYRIALQYEGPFTDAIYANKDRNKKVL